LRFAADLSAVAQAGNSKLLAATLRPPAFKALKSTSESAGWPPIVDFEELPTGGSGFNLRFQPRSVDDFATVGVARVG